MAKLTDTLDTVNSGRRIIAPADSGPSFLGGLADLVGNGLNAAASFTSQNEQIEGKKALDSVERKVAAERQKVSDAIRIGNTPLQGQIDFVNTPADVLVPAEIQRRSRELAKTQRAVDQGRRAQEAMDLEMEKFVSEMYAKYPDQASEIGQYMRTQGFDHYLWREQSLVDEQRVAGDKAQTTGYAFMIDKAVKSGYGNLGLDNDQLYQYGLKISQAEAQAEAAKAAAAEARAASGENRANAEFLKKQADEATYGAATAEINAHLGVMVDYLQNMAAAAQSDEDYMKLSSRADEVNATFERYGNHFVQQLQANGTPKGVVDAVKEEIDRNKKAVNEIFFGQTSRFEQKNRAFKYMQTEFGLSAEKALPLYMWAKRTLGPAMTEAVFSGDPSTALSPELRDKIKSELLRWDPTRPNDGLDMLAEIGLLAKGVVSLQDVPEAKITGDHVRALNSTVVRAREQIMDPEPDDPAEKQTFLGSLGNITIAALRIQPGTKDLKALNYALGAVYNDGNLGVLTSLLKDGQFKNQALPVFGATRQAAAQILEAARTAGPTVRGQRIVTKNGQFVVEVDKRNSIEGMAGIGSESGIEARPGAWDKAGVNPELQMQADIMNKASRYLALTAEQFGETKGYSYAELLDHYMHGTALKPKGGEGSGKAAPTIDNQLNAFDVEMRRLQNSIEKDLPFVRPKQPVSFTDAKDAIVRTVIGEAGAEGAVGKKAVAAVILNRARLSGQDPSEIVLKANQFEAWSDRPDELMGIDPNSRQYKEVAALVDQVMAGEDPTGGATHFYAPQLQSQLGRKPPKWDDGTGVDIGRHRFFKQNYEG